MSRIERVNRAWGIGLVVTLLLLLCIVVASGLSSGCSGDKIGNSAIAYRPISGELDLDGHVEMIKGQPYDANACVDLRGVLETEWLPLPHTLRLCLVILPDATGKPAICTHWKVTALGTSYDGVIKSLSTESCLDTFGEFGPSEVSDFALFRTDGQ